MVSPIDNGSVRVCMCLMYALVHNVIIDTVFFFFFVYISIYTCNGPCALSCIEKWRKKVYIIIIIIISKKYVD